MHYDEKKLFDAEDGISSIGDRYITCWYDFTSLRALRSGIKKYHHLDVEHG